MRLEMAAYKNILYSITRLICIGFLVFAYNNAAAGKAATNEKIAAPGRGIIPIVSDHYKTKPSFYDFDNMPMEHITNKIGRRFIMGTQSTLTRWDLKAGTKLPVHFHPNEQITRVEKGLLEVYSQGEKYIVKAGQVMIFPPNVPHEFIAVTDTVIYEQHTPPRQDFINGDFYKVAAKLKLPN